MPHQDIQGQRGGLKEKNRYGWSDINAYSSPVQMKSRRRWKRTNSNIHDLYSMHIRIMGHLWSMIKQRSRLCIDLGLQSTIRISVYDPKGNKSITCCWKQNSHFDKEALYICDHNFQPLLMVPIFHFVIGFDYSTVLHSILTQPIGNQDPLTYRHRKFHLQQEVLHHFKLFPFSYMHLSSIRETGLGYRAAWWMEHKIVAGIL